MTKNYKLISKLISKLKVITCLFIIEKQSEDIKRQSFDLFGATHFVQIES